MTMATLLTSLRAMVHDGPADHTIFGEKLGVLPNGYPVDGSNTVFKLGGEDGHSTPIVDLGTPPDAGSVFLTYTATNGARRTQTGFTISDAVNGFITFAVAPTAGIEILADYNYYWFSDTQHTEFLNEAAQTTQAGVTDPTQVGAGLIQAMMQFAAANFFQARASQYAERYATSGGQAGTSVDVVSKTYLSLAKAATLRGTQYRDEFYSRQGQRNAPAAVIVNYAIDPITPRH